MSSRPLLLGHRGARPGSGLLAQHREPLKENTLAAFEYAIANGCDGFEFDVRATRDGRCIICHDPKLMGKVIVNSAYQDLCESCGAELACLEDVLEQFAYRAYLDIELKESGYEKSVISALRANPPRCGCLVSSFRPQVIKILHELDPDLALGFICDREELLDLFRRLPVEMLLPEYHLVTEDVLDRAYNDGARVITWTVNRETELLRMWQMGVNGFISDDPALLGRLFPDGTQP